MAIKTFDRPADPDHVHEPAPHTRWQLDAYTEVGTCVCGRRIEQTERWIGGTTYRWPWQVSA